MKNLNKLTRGIVLLSLLAFVGVVGCSDSPSGPNLVTLEMAEGPASSMVNLVAGMENYNLQCQGCHGAMGQGASAAPLNNYALGETPAYATFSVLQAKIHSSMPRGNSGACEDTCADDVSGYIYCEWNSGLVTSGCPAP
jgi:mono/diheme cytochrome c family protein